MQNGVQATLCDGPDDLQVVGESHYQHNLWSLTDADSESERVRVPVIALLVPEIDNPYDPDAVAVWINGLKTGHLSGEDARLYRAGILAIQQAEHGPVAVPGVIAGGGLDGARMRALGVFLNVDRAKFGLPD